MTFTHSSPQIVASSADTLSLPYALSDRTAILMRHKTLYHQTPQTFCFRPTSWKQRHTDVRVNTARVWPRASRPSAALSDVLAPEML